MVAIRKETFGRDFRPRIHRPMPGSEPADDSQPRGPSCGLEICGLLHPDKGQLRGDVGGALAVQESEEATQHPFYVPQFITETSPGGKVLVQCFV